MKKWDECLFLNGEESIKDYFNGAENVLFILGKGFDPRTCTILEKMSLIINDLTVWIVDYKDKSIRENETNISRSNSNYERMLEICKSFNMRELLVPQYEGYASKKTLIVSESVRNSFKKEELTSFKKIIIDISAMPRGLGFSIIKRLIDLNFEEQQIYVMVCENSECDDKIKPVIANESAEYLPGFNTFSMSLEASNDETIWLPVLGMNEEAAFKIIAEYIKPVEICPIVPFPAMNIRRGENILRSYGETLFRENDVEKRNIIYVPENNPLLVYKKLYETVKYYEKALNANPQKKRAIKYAFSSQSSKLIDIGVLLAIINLHNDKIKTGIIIVENQGYSLTEEYNKENEKIYCLCLNKNELDW